MTTSSTPHAAYEHVALYHRGADDLGERLAPRVIEAVDQREAVLVSLGRRDWESLSDRLGRAADRVTYLEAGRRYATPGNAMAAVHRFATNALQSGASTVWSIGSIPFEGTGDDAKWVRYEAAVDSILGNLPCRLVCAYDTLRVDEHLLAAVCHSHSAIDGVDHRHELPDLSSASPTADPIVAPPLDQATIDTEVDNPGTVRQLLSSSFGSHLPAHRLADLHVVASELVTNGLRYGHPPVHVRAWKASDQLVLEVSDRGPGLVDPFPDLRPPVSAQQYGGYGLWIVGHLVDRFDLRRHDGSTIIRVALRC